MPSLRLVLGDQLTRSVASLKGMEKGDLVLMAEVRAEATYVKHHKKKIAFLFSAMRHFAEDLKDDGVDVRYRRYDDKHNAGSLFGELREALDIRSDLDTVIITAPGEYRLMSEMQEWGERLGCTVHIRDDDRFICTIDGFKDWAKDRKQYRMEFFYREMRKKTGILMTDDGQPEGGQWNYDQENRKPPKEGLDPPPAPSFKHDEITKEVLELVAREFGDHFGDLEPFDHMGVTHQHADQALDMFIEDRLVKFGDYQDAMVAGEPTMYHSLISAYLNAGLLDPMTCCDRAAAAYEAGKAPLNAVEGFIRQILGWREFVRGLYWAKMPEYLEMNALNAQRQLPEFYWTGDTEMRCLNEAVDATKKYAYAHHIQRLMVLGNFALLLGVKPSEINEWFLVVYADAYEWVEVPNVHGMAIFADGGILGSKPYASSGAYIDKMSNYCGDCRYKVKEKNGEDACPFNYLYWDFLMRNQETLKGNQRMSMIYSTLRKFSDEKREQIVADSERFFDSIARSDDHWYARSRADKAVAAE
ncbi:MAG: cryptochrome/photolyase family protein [Pseudomonadota bacterium]